MSEGFLPPNPAVDPAIIPPAVPRGVPFGQRPRDEAIVDIPKFVDPEWAGAAEEDNYSNADIDEALRRADEAAQTAAPFDQEAYEQARAEALARGETVDLPPAPVSDEEPTLTLTPEQREDMRRFISVGRMKGTVKVLGHTIDVETLNAMDEMNVGLYVKPYMNTPGFARAWTVATAAAGVRRVNGQPIFAALAPTEDESELFDQKVRIMARHYPYTITPVYDEIQRLDGQFSELAELLGKQFG